MQKIKRLPRRKSTYDFDMSKPIDLTLVEIPSDDCFSRIWEPSSAECRGCCDFAVCGTAFSNKMDKVTKKLEAKEEAEGSIFLDLSDWEAVDNTYFLGVIAKRLNAEKVCEYSVFLAAYMQQAKSSDKVAGEEKLNRLLFSNNYLVENGRIINK